MEFNICNDVKHLFLLIKVHIIIGFEKATLKIYSLNDFKHEILFLVITLIKQEKVISMRCSKIYFSFCNLSKNLPA